MRPCPRLRPAVLAMLLLTAAARTAAAQSVDVEAEHQRGMALRGRGRDAEAAEVFRSLFAQTGEPRALARLGLAEGALLRWTDADEHLSGALDRAADPWVAANRASLEEALRAVRRHLGLVTVSCAAPGARVQWSGQPPLSLPLAHPLRLPTGFLDLVVSAPGYSPATRRVAVSAGADPVVVEVTLTRDETATPVAAPTIAAAPTPAVRVTPVATPPVRAPRGATPRAWQRPLGIGLLAGSGVALGVGVLGAALREGAAGRFNAARCRLYPDRDEVSAGGPTCVDELSTVQTGDTLTVAGFVAAGVLGAAGVTALLLSPSRTTEAVRASIGPGPGGRGVMASATVRF
jgi:hypothetical protein